MRVFSSSKREEPDEPTLILSTAVHLRRYGYSMRMVIEAERAKRPDARLVSLLVKANAWKEKRLYGRHGGIEAIAREQNVTPSWLIRVLSLAFLSPEITQSILNGRQPVRLTPKTLIKDIRLALLNWSEQK